MGEGEVASKKGGGGALVLNGTERYCGCVLTHS